MMKAGLQWSGGLRPSGCATAGIAAAVLAGLLLFGPAAGRAQPVSALVVPLSASAAAGAPIVSGDLIVKFRDASEPGAQLSAVLGGQRSVASVAPIAARLAEELGVPLVLVQVTSGREALLALDRSGLARALVARAQREPAVRRATVVPAADAALVLPSGQLVLRLELRGASPAADLAGRLAAGGLVAPHLQAEPGADGWRASYDIDALTLALIARLQQRPDVEYVQPNRLLRPATGASR